MLKKVKFIYNPAAGENIVTEYLDRIVELYQQKGFSLVLYRMAFDRPPEEITFDLDSSYHHILIAGGDGTVNYVVNLLKNAGTDIPVAILPAGTANDFAGMLDMPADIIKACEAVLGGEERKVDLGLVNGVWYMNVFSCGLFTDISQKTPTIVKNNFGKIAYYINGLGELPRFRKMELSIKTDGGNFEGQALIFFVFNGRTAGSLQLAYLSEIDDGLLDVLIVKADTALDTIRTAFQYPAHSRRRKAYPEGIVHIKCSRLTALSVRPETTDIDGQPGPEFPIDISCEAGALRVIATKPKIR